MEETQINNNNKIKWYEKTAMFGGMLTGIFFIILGLASSVIEYRINGSALSYSLGVLIGNVLIALLSFKLLNYVKKLKRKILHKINVVGLNISLIFSIFLIVTLISSLIISFL